MANHNLQHAQNAPQLMILQHKFFYAIFFWYIFQKALTVLWVEFEGCPLLIDGLSGSGFVWHAGHALYASDEYLKNKSETC